jgi:hypothetical protein
MEKLGEKWISKFGIFSDTPTSEQLIEENKIRKVCTVEYTKFLKAFFTPHSVGVTING